MIRANNIMQGVVVADSGLTRRLARSKEPHPAQGLAAHDVGDGLAEVLCGGLAAHVGSERLPGADDLLDRGNNGVGRLLVPEVLEHHRARPDLTVGVGVVLAVVVWRGVVVWLVYGRLLVVG